MNSIIFLTGHTYIGCYDDYNDRTLPYFETNVDYMTNEYCADHCCSKSQTHTYMGTEVYIIKIANTGTLKTKIPGCRNSSKIQ